MAILINKETQVLIQGITGKVGSFQAQIMKEYGTKIVAEVTPGKGDTEVFGIPVYDLVEEAVAEHRIDAVLRLYPRAVLPKRVPWRLSTAAFLFWF